MHHQPTILIVHGAWHTPEPFAPFIALLSEQGYPSICPHLPTCNGDNPPTKTLKDDVELIRRMATGLVDQGKEVVVLMHSYGGVVGTDALYGLGIRRQNGTYGGGIVKLLYMCAFIPLTGQSLAGIMGGASPPWVVQTETDAGTVLEVPDPIPVFYNDVENPEQWSDKLVVHPKSAQYTPVTHEAFGEYPCTYLLCEKDQGLSAFVQQMMIDKVADSGCVFSTEKIEAGHSPFLSMPGKLVDFIHRESSC